MNATEPIRRQARVAPGSVAFVTRQLGEVTYGELERTVDAVAHGLRARSVAAGQRAAIGIADYYRHLVVALAVARLGAEIAPIVLPARLADVAIVDAGASYDGVVPTLDVDEIFAEALGAPPAPPGAIDTNASRVLIQCPSSGTTGAPKFIPVSHELAARRIFLRSLASRLPGEIRQVCFVASSTWYGFASVLRVLWMGGVVVEPNFEGDQMASWLERTRINYLAAAPNALGKVAAVCPYIPGRYALQTIEVAGSALPPAVRDLARQRLCSRLHCAYGSTESAGVASAPVSMLGNRAGAAGYAFPGVQIEVVDESDAALPAGREGIVRIRSELNAREYLDDPVASAQVFRDGWVYPGDVGLLMPDGLLVVTGRTDDVINHGGEKVSPQAVEDVLMTLAPLRESAVFGATDQRGMTQICAAVVSAQPLDVREFHARCRDALGLRAPVLIMQLPELPRNDNGKVLRRELARMAEEADRQQAARAVPPA